MTDKAIKQHLLTRKATRKEGRPPLEDCQCFKSILWTLWSELPERYGFKSAPNGCLPEWAKSDLLLNLWHALLDQLPERQKVRWDECMCVRGKKGVRWSGKLKAAREQRLWYWLMARALRSEYPPGKASPSEVKLAEATLANIKVKAGKRKRGKPQRLTGDKGYDSNQIRVLLENQRIEPIIRVRSNSQIATRSRPIRSVENGEISAQLDHWVKQSLGANVSQTGDALRTIGEGVCCAGSYGLCLYRGELSLDLISSQWRKQLGTAA